MKKEKKVEKTVKKSNAANCKAAKWINLCAMLVGIILLAVGIFVKQVEMPFKLIGVLLVWGSGISYAVRSDKHVLIKSVIWSTFIAILLTWLFPSGAYQGATYASYGLKRIGINDVPSVIYYAIYFALDKLMYLLAIAGFYGVLSVTKGYRKLVTDVAKKIEPYKTTYAIVTMIILMLLTAILSNQMVIIFFIPFILSVYNKMGVDKMTAFLTTFGALLLGMLSAPWGSDSLYWFNYYMGVTLKEGFTLRLIISACLLVLSIIVLILRARNISKGKYETVVEDVFEIEPLKDGGRKAPLIIIMAVVCVLIILGFVDWVSCFNIEVFTKFHEWLMGLTIGKDVAIFAYLFGTSAKMFGAWDISTFVTIILVTSIIVGLVYRIKLADFLTAFGRGMQKMAKPIAIYVSTFALFVVMYITPIFPTITNWLLGLTENFNLYLTSVMGFITSIFHADLGYTGYAVGQFLTTAYADHLAVAHTTYFTMYGLAQLILPTSGILVLGLVTTKVSYKEWLKYIWKIALIIIILIMIILTIATYV